MINICTQISTGREQGVTNGAKVIHIRRLKSDPGVNLLS
ncbi:chemotaxis protein [Salmonella enterica subsp. enterica serovar Bonariensis]|nr:chemotaxis protein [Salmonella enterica subsp. enterica serovar Bonariensis]